MYKPLVSVVIPVYNGSNYLNEAIDSVLCQTYENIEIIVVNDGSADETEEIALSYGNQIRYYSKQNGGVATALNYAIDRMRGEYFSWLSHDDMYYPNKIEEQVEALNKSEDKTTIVYSGYDVIDENSNFKTNISHMETYKLEELTNSVFPVIYGLIHGCTLLIHRSHFDRVGTFDEGLKTTQDYDLWFKMFRDQQTIYIDEPLVLGRLHESQGSKTIKCHDKERNNLHIGFMNKLKDEEIISMFGSKYSFYHKMACFFKGGNMLEGYNFALERFQNEEIPEDVTKKIYELKEYLSKLSGGNATRICIFCAGNYGLRLYEELRSRLIHVDCFSDNDSRKWGHILGNTHCISTQELEKNKETTLVIVATRTPNDIIEQLKQEGFPYVITKQQLDRIIKDIPPIKWVSSLEALEEIDYSSKGTLLLIEKFNQIIFNICTYYEQKLMNKEK